MTEETKTSEQPKENPPSEDAISKLRDEFQQQFSTMKESFEAENKKNLDLITKLTKENEDLHRALVRSAQLPPEQKQPEKTEQEIYQEKIAEYSKKSIAYEKYNRGLKV